MQYVEGLKSKDHQYVKHFKVLIGCMLDKAAEGIKEIDRLIGRCIARESGDDKCFETLAFQEADLKEVADAYCAWQRFRQQLRKSKG